MAETTFNIEFPIKYLAENCGKILNKGAGHDNRKAQTSMQIVDVIADYVKDECFLLRADDAMMCYDGMKYSCVLELDFQSIISGAFKRLGIGEVYDHPMVWKLAYEKSMVMLRKHNRRLKHDRKYLVFNNGVFDINKGKLLGFSSEYITDLIFDFDYDEKATCDKWIECLDFWLPDYATRLVLQEFVGSFFIDRKRYQLDKICMLEGGGSNGKSVFLNVIVRMLGLNATKYSPQDLFRGEHSKNSIAMCDGKLANICSDAGKFDFSGGEVKQFASNEPLAAKFLYKDVHLSSNLPMLMFSVNERPITTDTTDGYFRRFAIITFGKKIPKEMLDTQLGNKLSSTEISGIFNWAMEGRARLVKQSGIFTTSELMVQNLDQYRTDSDSVLSFMSDMGYTADAIVGESSNRVNAKELYIEYEKYCEENGFRGKCAKKTMGQRLSQYLGIKSVKSNGNCYYNLWKIVEGCKFVKDLEPDAKRDAEAIIADQEVKKAEQDKVDAKAIDNLPF